MVDIEKINAKMQEWQDKDALMRKSKEELVEIIESLIIGGEIGTIALKYCCEDLINLMTVLGGVSDQVDSMLGRMLAPFKSMAKIPVDYAVRDYVEKAIVDTCEIEDSSLEEFLKAHRNDSSLSDKELLDELTRLMGMDGKKRDK